MIRTTNNCGSSLFTTEEMVNNYMSFTGLTQYCWKTPTMIDGPDDPDPKSANKKQARGTIQYGPDEEDPRQAEEPQRRFMSIFLDGDSGYEGSRKSSPRK
ncbi:hypothetical protein B0T09DRAFT_107481 [Sordaria sp. MPI-SDFR-AT-0083]|nr:hypothetical protein B0T09DRAFT_107481 [Sordaria sp. MPI-SDFR-AT-0083]